MALGDRFSALLTSLESKIELSSKYVSTESNIKQEYSQTKSSSLKVQKSSDREKETDQLRLRVRQKQIDYGKNTKGYENLIKKYPKKYMRPKEGPWTPRKDHKCSKRSWDGQIKKWRRQLHAFDDTENDMINDNIDLSFIMMT